MADQSAAPDAGRRGEPPLRASRPLGRGGRRAPRRAERGLSSCVDAVVAVIDDDCVADPGWIATVERMFAADPVLALVAGRVLRFPRPGPRHFRCPPVPVGPGGSFREVAPWNVGSGNNFAVRREWFERVGGCDQRLGPGTPGHGALDMDLFYRVLRPGARPVRAEGRGPPRAGPGGLAGHVVGCTATGWAPCAAFVFASETSTACSCSRHGSLCVYGCFILGPAAGALGDPPRGGAGVGRNRNGLCARALPLADQARRNGLTLVEAKMSLAGNLREMERTREAYWLRYPATSPIKLRWRALTVRHCFHVLPGESVLEVGAGAVYGPSTWQPRSRGENPITAAVFNADLAGAGEARQLPTRASRRRRSGTTARGELRLRRRHRHPLPRPVRREPAGPAAC